MNFRNFNLYRFFGNLIGTALGIAFVLVVALLAATTVAIMAVPFIILFKLIMS